MPLKKFEPGDDIILKEIKKDRDRHNSGTIISTSSLFYRIEWSDGTIVNCHDASTIDKYYDYGINAKRRLRLELILGK